MEVHHNSPGKAPEKEIVFILASTVVSVEMRVGFSKSRMFKIIMDVADGRAFAPFPVVAASSIKKLTCCGIASHITPNVTLHMTLMLKVIARSQHTSTFQQKKLVLARLMCVQKHTSSANCFVL